MTLLIAFFCIALGVSFLCSLSESVLLSVPRAYIALLSNKGHKSGPVLKDLKDRIDRPLAAILTFNTIATAAGAAVVGAQTLRVFGSQWVALASAILTFSLLVFSEIIPKVLGVLYWRKLAPVIAYFIRILIFAAFPLVLLLRGISFLIARNKHQSHLTKDDLLAFAHLGEKEGILLEKEARIIENLFRLNKIEASEVLTPRSVIWAFQKDQTIAEVVKENNPIRFSKIPVYDKNIDNVIGMVYRSKVLETYFRGEVDAKIESICEPIYFIPQTKSIARILDEFIKRKEHIFLVVDEYGGTEGIITLEDAIETLLGVEIVDELDVDEDMRTLAKKKWQERSKGFRKPSP